MSYKEINNDIYCCLEETSRERFKKKVRRHVCLWQNGSYRS